MSLSQEDLKNISLVIEEKVSPIASRLDTLEMQGKTTQRRFDELETEFKKIGERIDNVTDRLDELSDQSDKLNEDVTYIKQKQRQDHLEVMVKLDDLKTQETEDIEAAYTDIEKLKKRVTLKKTT